MIGSLISSTRTPQTMPSIKAREGLIQRPCLNAFRLAFGAPGEGPPCILHRPFAIAGDGHGLAPLVLAPQRFAWCISKCMGLILRFDPHPTRLHVAGNSLVAFVDVDVFDRNFLLLFAAMPV
jgi:hypothetical protein